ncbi:MAG TPA: tetratricopeptide repeat-containing sensor histidine kinase [Melioribacteraceae bacterium]|nr:tetratricopeptide repeat-containing sensor histidine kinase [Melioribacteraceae bacterium]
MKKFLLYLFLFSPFVLIYAEKADSVLNLLKGKSESEKVKVLTNLCWENRNVNPKLALEYGFTAINKIEKHGLTIPKSKLYNFVGVVYSHLGNLDSSYYFYQKGLFEATKTNDSLQLAYSLNNLGDYYLQSSLYSLALEKFFQSNKLFIKLNDKIGLAYSYNDIGQIFFNQENYDKALLYFNKSITIRKELNDYRGIGKSLTNIAAVYEAKADYKKALEVYSESEKFSNITKYYKGLIYAYLGYSNIYYKLNELNEALDYNKKGLDLSLQINSTPQIIASYNDRAKILLKLTKINEAKQVLEIASSKASKSGLINMLAVSYQLLKEIAIKEGNFKLALQYSDDYTTLKDSIYSAGSVNKIADLQTAYLVQLKESENNLLKREIDAERTKIKYLGIIAFLVALLLFLGVSRYKLLKDLNKKLSKEIEAKNKLFSIIAHDLNNPVGAISSVSEFLRTDYNEIDEEDKKELVESIADASKNIQLMIGNLLNWARSQREGIKINKSDLNVYDLLVNIAESYKFLAKKKSIEIVVEAPKDLNILADKFVTETILGNLVTNAVKFSPKNNKIVLSAIINKNNAVLEVKDFGLGMSQDTIDLIINKDKSFTSLGTDKERGIGLGLQIVKELVSLHNSKITIASELNKGTSFKIEI